MNKSRIILLVTSISLAALLAVWCLWKPELEIPRSFTPNGDGVDDRFVIANLEHYPENSLRVTSKLGDVVYQASPYQNDWDGTRSTNGVKAGSEVITAEDRKLPEGDYTYTLETGADGSGTAYIGYVYIELRERRHSSRP